MVIEKEVEEEIEPKELAIEFEIDGKAKKGYLAPRESTYYAIKGGEVISMQLDDMDEELENKLLLAYFSNPASFKSSEGEDLQGILLSTKKVGRPVKLKGKGHALEVYEKQADGSYKLQPKETIDDISEEVYNLITQAIKSWKGELAGLDAPEEKVEDKGKGEEERGPSRVVTKYLQAKDKVAVIQAYKGAALTNVGLKLLQQYEVPRYVADAFEKVCKNLDQAGRRRFTGGLAQAMDAFYASAALQLWDSYQDSTHPGYLKNLQGLVKFADNVSRAYPRNKLLDQHRIEEKIAEVNPITPELILETFNKQVRPGKLSVQK